MAAVINHSDGATSRVTPAVQGTAAFAKGILLVQLVADAEEFPTKAELRERSGFPRQTLHRLLKALIAEQLLEETPDKRYRMGARMFLFAGRALEQNDILQRAQPIMRRLSERTQETTHLAIRSGAQMVYLLKEDSPQAVRLATSVGGRVDLHASAIGKSMLAFLPTDERDSIIADLGFPRLTKYTVRSPAALRRQLASIHEAGYAIADQESSEGVYCFGAPIFDHRRIPVAGLSISIPSFRLKQHHDYVAPLLDACRDISSQLGGHIQ